MYRNGFYIELDNLNEKYDYDFCFTEILEAASYDGFDPDIFLHGNCDIFACYLHVTCDLFMYLQTYK